MAHPEKTDDTTTTKAHDETKEAPDEVKGALQRLVELADKYDPGPNQEVRDAIEWARKVLAKATAVKVK